MTGRFSMVNAEQCKHYARFMSHLTLPQANALFWLLFGFVLFLMCISSLQHHRSIGLDDLEKGMSQSQANSAHHRKKVRRLRFRYLSIACLCLFISIICVILECFTLFNIEYCDGEDLMQLYWGFWSVLQVGSIIAILGVIVQFWIVLGNVETPSWAVALGTPVLVFAALGWIFRESAKRIYYRCTGKIIENEDSEDSDEEDANGGGGDCEKCGMDRWLSRAPTIVPERNNGDPSGERSGAQSPRRHSTF